MIYRIIKVYSSPRPSPRPSLWENCIIRSVNLTINTAGHYCGQFTVIGYQLYLTRLVLPPSIVFEFSDLELEQLEEESNEIPD